MENENRHLELSNKFLQMGQALINEGINNNDYIISQSGTIMILVASLMVNEQDMFIFSELCAMFSSKKILDAQEGLGQLEQDMFLKLLKNKNQGLTNQTEQHKKKRGRKPSNPKSPDEN